MRSGNIITAVLTVSDPVAITTQPVSQSVCLSFPVSFSITASGSNLSYEWFRNGNIYRE